MDVGDLIKVLGAVATAAAACTGALIAWRGLEKWRSETIGKKRSELAATVLADFYEMEEIIRSSRAPFVLAHEMGAIEGVPDDIASNSSYAPERRLLQYQEFFGRFRSRKHEFAAVFGKAAAEPFDNMWKLRLEINWAVDAMLRSQGGEKRAGQREPRAMVELVQCCFSGDRRRPRPIVQRLQNAVAAISRFADLR